MAFFRKVGSMLGRSISNDVSLSNPSIFQALRMMSSSKVFVGGLSWSTSESDLREAFNKYGEVNDAKVVVDYDTGRSRGFGFVTYSSVEEASASIQAMDQRDFGGRTIRVDYANDRSRGYGGGGGYNNYGSGGGGGGGYNNNDYNNSGSYGSGSNYNNYGANSYGSANASYGSDQQSFGTPAGGDTYFGGGAGGSGYDGFGDKSTNNVAAGGDDHFGGDDMYAADRRN